MAAPRKIDWDRIEPDWRAGIKSLSQMAAEYKEATGVSVTHTAIRQHFNKRGIPRDLKAKIRERAKAKVSAAMVSKKPSGNLPQEAEIIESNAEIQANVQLAHRVDIRKARALAASLMDELAHQTGNTEEYQRLREIVEGEGDDIPQRLRDLYQRALSLPGRVDTMKKLADTLHRVITLERQAFGLDDLEFSGKTNDVQSLTRDELMEIARGYHAS